MKRISILFFISLFIFPNLSSGQSFDKGVKVIEVSPFFGIAVFKTKITDNTTDSSRTGKAAAGLLPLSFEYGLSKKLGVGAVFAYNSFLHKKDSSGRVRDFDVALKCNLHYGNKDRFDAFSGIAMGYSYLNITTSNSVGFTANGNGFFWDLGLITTRFYFGSHVGMYLNLGYMGYFYENLKFSDGIGDTNYYQTIFKGIHLGTGLTVRL